MASTATAKPAAPPLRRELATIAGWIPDGARVLDLGCGDGALLSALAARGVRGYGLEIDPANVAACVARGVNVIQADLDDGLKDFDAGSFDVVLLTHTLQALAHPDAALAEMLRVGGRAIVTFPNFGHWRVRAALLAGRMPRTPSLPATWYDTPNIHLCTVDDFEALCADKGWRVTRRVLLNRRMPALDGVAARVGANLLGETALYEIRP